jgi:hypothetical protein
MSVGVKKRSGGLDGNIIGNLGCRPHSILICLIGSRCSRIGTLRWQVILPCSGQKFYLFYVSFIIPSETLGGKTRLFREYVLEEFSDALYLAAASLCLWPIGTCEAVLVFDGHILQEVLKHLDIFWWLAHLHKWSDKYGVVVQLHHVV